MDETAFLKALCEEPEEQLHKLAFADWCEERGEYDKAKALRYLAEYKKHPCKCYVKKEWYTYVWWVSHKSGTSLTSEGRYLLNYRVYQHLSSTKIKNIYQANEKIYREYYEQEEAWLDVIQATTKAIELGKL